MQKNPIDKEVIIDRLAHIQRSLERLREMKKMTPGEFMLEDNFAIAEHYLRYAIEATFDICAHILARIPGAEVGEYKVIAREMGAQGILPKKFAEETLQEMAGYRNRLTHFYFEITPREMYDILRNNMEDFEVFMRYIRKELESV
jgi:uncharacterized protein YutE (UPF0331/DUF86 family)